MKKINMLFILAIMLIALVGVVSGSQFPQYLSSQYYGDNDIDTYNTKSTESGGIDYNNLDSCVIGIGSDMGVYPIAVNYNNYKYSYLVVPTLDTIRIYNSNCTQINSISIPNIEFYGTMDTFVEVGGINKYVLVGKNTSDTSYAFYSFKFNTDTLKIEYDNKKDIGASIVTSYFNGVACGSATDTGIGTGGCAIANNNNLYYWDIEHDTLNTYVSTYSMSRNVGIGASSSYSDFWSKPYGAVVDFDADGNNEIVFATYGYVGGYKFFYEVFDMVNLNFEKEIAKATPLDPTWQNLYSSNSVSGYPCQIGSRTSYFEVCYDVVYIPSNSPNTANLILNGNDGTTFAIIPKTKFSTSVNTFDYNNDGLLDYVAHNENGLGTTYIYDFSNTQIDSVSIDIGSLATGFSSFIMDIDDDSTEELIYSNGEIYDFSTGKIEYELNYLTNSSKGYLIGGDLNGDLENELIYIDSVTSYVYSTNPTNDYISFTGEVQGEGNCTYEVASVEVCEELILNDDCTTTIINNCFESINNTELFDCPFSTQSTEDGCLTLLTYPDCSTYHINACYNIVGNETETPTEDDEDLPFLLGKIQDNVKVIFGIIIIILSLVTAVKNGVKEPIVLIIIGVLATILGSVFGLIPSSVLIILIVVMALLLLLGMTIFKKHSGE